MGGGTQERAQEQGAEAGRAVMMRQNNVRSHPESHGESGEMKYHRC